MGRAFEATEGELAEKLFAALKAGDDAGGDSRGKQSASMLVVRKGGGRNINNDRYIYINVDDGPDAATTAIQKYGIPGTHLAQPASDSGGLNGPLMSCVHEPASSARSGGRRIPG